MTLRRRALGIDPACRHAESLELRSVLIRPDGSSRATDGSLLLEYFPRARPGATGGRRPTESGLHPFRLSAESARALRLATRQELATELDLDVRKSNRQPAATVRSGNGRTFVEPKLAVSPPPGSDPPLPPSGRRA